MKRLLSIALALCITLSCVIAVDFTAVDTQAYAVDSAEVSASIAPQSSIQGSAILHCFNWSYNNIKNNLQAIKDAGYTAVQTSPVQQPKDYNGSWRDQRGQWWKLYQPLGFYISNNSWLGNKNELKSLCDTAESMGIKVIVDVVANHVSGSGPGVGAVDWNVDSYLKNGNYIRDNNYYANNDNDRHNMTTGSIGMPDLNTNNTDLQNRVKSFLVECINVGVDGFRFDAAKHIELPNDPGNSSQFWPTVINGSQSSTSREIYYYGEILNGCGTDIRNYTQYMSVTDNYSGDAILVAVNNSNASGLASSAYHKGAAADKTVLWAESHDTYMGESGSAGISCTSGVSDDKIVKAYAMVASRAYASSLYFARPANNMGDASSNTTYKSKTVAEVNKFKNYFDGQSEYLGSDGSIAYNVRGNSGVVLVNANGSSTSVNINVPNMANGTYKDYVTGNSFTVSNGRISGNIGSSGVAVVYNQNSTSQPTVPPTTPPTVPPTTPPTQPVEKYLVGDVNSDDSVSITDATTVQRFLSKSTAFSAEQKRAADVDLNGEVNVVDATYIQQYVAGIVQESSSCGKYVEGGEVMAPTVAPTQPPLPVGDYIYYKNTQGWSSVKIYYWSDSDTNMISWPGKDMTSLSDNVYSAEIPSSAQYVIFNDGSSQTQNITLQGVNKIYTDGNWSDYGNNTLPTIAPTQSQTPQPTQTPVIDSTYIYYKNNDNWGEVKVYYWSDSNNNMTGWPGIHMEPVGNNVYRAQIPQDATKVVFNNNNQGAQTSDISLEGLGKIYDNGSWSVYNG